MKRNIFIGGAWPYANNSLHLGHLAALLPGDAVARYHRQNGDTVIYVSGTDSHGTPITLRARKENVPASEIANRYHKEFSENFKALNFSYDLYTNTMTERHSSLVQEYLKKIKEKGYIYEKEELEDFCPNCDKFLADREVIGECPHCGGLAKGDQCEVCLASLNADEVKNKKCGICGGEIEQRPNKHLYFALSKFQNVIENLVSSKEKVWRSNALNETKKYLGLGLHDRAITRQLEWGVDVPFEGYEDKKIYVWIEAVFGYLTAGQQVAEKMGIDFNDFMTNENTISYYAHGKDNIPFHTYIFPSLLNALDEKINLPNVILACEYVNMNNEKMSKSKGNLISANDLISMYPSDSIRYYMLAYGPETKDINFSLDDFVQVHNKFLVGVFGNFINRNLSFINKKFEGKIPNGNIDESIISLTKETYAKVGELIEQGKIKQAIENVMAYAVAGNKYYDDQKPWIQVKEDIEAFNNSTYTCVYMMANMSNLFAPFMPDASKKIKEKLGLDVNNFEWKPVELGKDLTVKNNDLLFERYEIK